MLDVRTPLVPLWPTDDSQNQFIYYISGGYIVIYFLILFIASVSRRKEVGLKLKSFLKMQGCVIKRYEDRSIWTNPIKIREKEDSKMTFVLRTLLSERSLVTKDYSFYVKRKEGGWALMSNL